MQSERWALRGEARWWLVSRSTRPPSAGSTGPAPSAGSGLTAKGVLVRAAGRRWDRQQLLLNTQDFKLKKKGNFKQKQGGHPGSLALDYAIICWFQVMWKILLIFLIR